MSDLIETVKRILSDNECEKYSVTAPKVIRAVLSHFAEAGNVTDGMQQGYEKLFDPLSEVHTRKAAIAAAMAAALKEMAP